MLEAHRTGSYIHPDDPGEPSTGYPRLSVTDLEAAILTVLVDGLIVLEIGTGLGVSTQALALSARTVHTVDVDRWVWENIWPTLPANVVTHRTVESVPQVDVAFIDGDHRTAAVLEDLDHADARARVVIAHDTAEFSVRNALGDGWRYIPTTHGLGVKR